MGTTSPHPHGQHHLEMFRMWGRSMLDLIYCCWVIQVALASKVGYKAVDDYVKSGPLGLQGETPVSEDWKIQKPTNISVFVGEKQRQSFYTHWRYWVGLCWGMVIGLGTGSTACPGKNASCDCASEASFYLKYFHAMVYCEQDFISFKVNP